VTWVAVQLVLIAGVLAAPLAERGSWPLPVVAAGVVLAIAGAALLVWAARALGRSLSPLPQPRAGAELVTEGPFAHVRHPIYTGGIALATGWSAATSSWLALALSALLAGWLNLKSRHEERLLRAGLPGYDAYATRVRGRFLPRG
jgi:protein-S-isoprenylcysteine O-methyltransferase Ste14